MSEIIEAKHENGYSGKLYGKSSMSIYDQDGKEVLHTGFRNINTQEELYSHLADMPAFLESIAGIFKDEEGEEQ